MTQWNVILLLYIAITSTFAFVHLLNRHRWKVIKYLIRDSVEGIEKKVYGFDKSPSATILTDEGGKVTSINAAAVKMFGFSEDEMIKTGLKLIVPERFFTAHQEGMKRVIGKEMADKVFLLVATKKDNSEIPIELLLRKEKIKNDYFYLSIIRDRTKEVENDAQLREVIEGLKFMVDILNQGEVLGGNGSWFWDIKTSRELPESKLFVSDNYKRIMGIEDYKHFDAKYLKSRVWSEDVEIVNEALKKAFRGESYAIVYRMNRSSDFKVILVRSVAKPIKDENGVVVHIYGYTHLIQTMNVVEAINQKL